MITVVRTFDGSLIDPWFEKLVTHLKVSLFLSCVKLIIFLVSNTSPSVKMPQGYLFRFLRIVYQQSTYPNTQYP